MNFLNWLHDRCFSVLYLGYKYLISPKLLDEKFREREFIYNGILLASLGLLVLLLPFLWFGFLYDVLVLFGVYACLFIFSRIGLVTLSWRVYVIFGFILSVFPSLYLGEIRVLGLVGLVVSIVLAGIFVNRHGALVASILSWFLVVVLYEKWFLLETSFGLNVFVLESLSFCLLVGSMLMLSWMFNHDVKHFLRKGGSLEVVMTDSSSSDTGFVSDRLGELYRFAEFGRLAGSLFHDMANPLSALLLHLDKVKNKALFVDEQVVLKQSYEQMFGVAKQLDDFIVLVKKHGGSGGDDVCEFAPSGEVVSAAQVFLHKMHKTGVSVRVEADETILIYGSPLKLYQVVLNLISNAIDSYASLPHDVVSRRGVVLVKLFKDEDFVVLSVQDFGSGIKSVLLEKIFEPFYTTKPIGSGSGIGLANVKEIVEVDFGGRIEVVSEVGKGSVFRVVFRDYRG